MEVEIINTKVLLVLSWLGALSYLQLASVNSVLLFYCLELVSAMVMFDGGSPHHLHMVGEAPSCCVHEEVDESGKHGERRWTSIPQSEPTMTMTMTMTMTAAATAVSFLRYSLPAMRTTEFVRQCLGFFFLLSCRHTEHAVFSNAHRILVKFVHSRDPKQNFVIWDKTPRYLADRQIR